jgi:signal transduction histidine kinase
MDPPDRMWPRWVPLTAAAFSVSIALLAPFAHRTGATSLAAVVLLLLATLPWLLEAAGRTLPRPAFAAGVYVPLAVLNLYGGSLGLDMRHDGQLSFMLLTLAAGQLAASTPLRQVPFYSGLAVLLPLGRFAVEPAFVEWVFWSAGILLATGAGILLQRQQTLVEQLRAAQAALTEEAAVAERRRIAREVHDVIAHSLTVSMLHVTAARLAVRRDAEEAQDALAEAERLGRQALNDVRRTVGLLHEGESTATAAALPGAADLPALVESYAAAGLMVDFQCAVDLSLATPTAGLALYRAVQEALANATKHARGAPVTVSVTRDGDQFVVEIVNPYEGEDQTVDSTGMGLRGMRERVEALGGTFFAGPRGDGWVTSCVIPLRSAP